MKRILPTLLVVLSLSLGACGTVEAEPTMTPSATFTPRPTNTATATVTVTPTPRATATKASVNLASPYVVSSAFTIGVPELYFLDLYDGQVFITDMLQSVFVVALFIPGESAGEAGLLDFVDWFAQDFDEVEPGDPYTIDVNQFTGLAVEFTARMDSTTIEGKAVLLNTPGGDIYMAGSNVSGTALVWRAVGEPAFDSMLDSIELLSEAEANAECPVSADDTYGYTEDNPIRVGGDAFAGPGREDAYLGHLLGPNGEPVNFERVGSLGSGDTILDLYSVTSSGFAGERQLFLDEYSYESPSAPVGFSCEGPFPLAEP